MANTTTQTFPRRLGELFDFEGQLAQFRGDYLDRETPQHHFRIAVARHIPAGDYPHAIGQTVQNIGGRSWSGYIRVGWNGDQMVRTDGWEEKTISLPVAKPRDGKTYTWRWSDFALGRHGVDYWTREYFPRCAECGEVHNPKRCPHA